MPQFSRLQGGPVSRARAEDLEKTMAPVVSRHAFHAAKATAATRNQEEATPPHSTGSSAAVAPAWGERAARGVRPSVLRSAGSATPALSGPRRLWPAVPSVQRTRRRLDADGAVKLSSGLALPLRRRRASLPVSVRSLHRPHPFPQISVPMRETWV